MRQPSDCSVRFWLALGVTIFLIALGARCVQGADLEVRVYKFNSTQVQGRRVTMTLLEPGPVVAGPWLIPGDAVAQYTDTTGVTVFSNVLAGAYRLDIAGSPSRSFPLTVPDTNALLNVADLINNTNGTPSFYTSAQVDALLENLPTTGGTTGVDTNTVNVLALQAARTVVSTNPIPATNVSGKVSAAATADTATSVPLASVTGRGTLDEWALLNPLSFVPPGAGVDTNAVYSIAQQVAQTNIVPATNISGKVASASAADTASTAATATNAVTAQQLVPVPNGTNILSLGPTNGPADMWIGLDHIVDFSTGVNLAKGFGLTLAGTPQLPSWLNYLSNAIATLPPGTNGGTTFQQSPSGHWFEVVNTNTQVAVMGVTSNDVTFANLGLATNLPRAGVVGQVAKDSEQDGRLDALEAGGGGGGSATNVFEVQWSGTATNNTFEPVLTNMVAANHTHAGTAWVRGAGATNVYFGRLDWLYFRGDAPLFTYSSNVFAASGGLGAFVTTNVSGQLVFALQGAANEGVNWSIKAFTESLTNGYPVAVGGGGGGGDNTLTNDMVALWSFEGEPWVDSIGTNNLTEAGTVTFPSGLVGLASGFDASPDALTAAATADFMVTNGFSFAIWVYLNATNINGPLVVKDSVSDGNRVFASYYSSAGQNFRIAICTNLTGATITYVTGTTNNHATAQPYFVAGTFNPTNKTVSLYVGTTNANSLVLEKEQVFDPWIKDAASVPIRLGAWSTYLNGKLDEAGIWRRSLSGADVTNVWSKALEGKRVNEP